MQIFHSILFVDYGESHIYATQEIAAHLYLYLDPVMECHELPIPNFIRNNIRIMRIS